MANGERQYSPFFESRQRRRRNASPALQRRENAVLF
jgi:hypothetical protein